MTHRATPLEKFNRMAVRSASTVIACYSTSFSLASTLLGPETRTHIRNLYAVVRIADEIVDGVAAEAGLSGEDIAEVLNRFEADTCTAIEKQFSPNPALHAFAKTARTCRIDPEHLRAFFASMRADLTPGVHTPSSREEYVFGSAEVIGLMCLSIFTFKQPLNDRAQGTCSVAARHLGKAFQLINFLRDYHTDDTALGRHYLDLTEASKAELIAEIREDLKIALLGIPVLPLTARSGVYASYLLFQDLTDRLEAATLAEIQAERVRVPAARKSYLAARAVALAPRMKEN
ncbi:All-trans-phytoene synthase [Corynebacterium kalinowskii]|uniref:All-trans-phytoene synthase n=1 Tax=Corynebacterium kalinowskii TaxID=2675216 RepID=A0A6B8V926_9CORY|nr:squalene/phytoene synthase family protein [Corynebacterium kalinowskii]QGU01582.1 All-trans-phytoene synthase [Corynebacterium kalinowskii]